MANVLFKQGLQSNLDNIRKNLTAKDGTFYLTTDSHRLYIGRITDSTKQTADACDAVPVNEGVTTVSALSELPKVTTDNAKLYAGQFYYVSNDNILCVYSGSQNGWVQLNPNTDTKIEGVDISITVTDGVATVNTKVSYTDENGESSGKYKDDSFQVAAAGGAQIKSEDVTVGDKTLNKLTITGEEYSLDSTADSKQGIKVKLKSSFTTDSVDKDSEVTLVKPGDNIQIKSDGTISATDTTLNSSAGAAITAGAGNNGHNGSGAAVDTSTKGFYVKVKDSNSNELSASIDPKIVLGTNTDTSYEFDNGTATLPVYTKEELDRKLANLDAMTFKGTIGTGSAITAVTTFTDGTTAIHAGDTYKTTSAVYVTDQAGKSTKTDTGDLIIAIGTEYTLEDVTTDATKAGTTYTRADGTTGTYTTNSSDVGSIIPSTLKWAVIESGDDDELVIKYKGEAIDNGIKLMQNEATNVAELTIAAAENGYVTVSDSKDASDKTKNKVLISHNTTTRSDTTEKAEVQTAVSSVKVNVVTGVTSNATGHITGISTKEYTLVDSNGYVGDNFYTATVTSDTTDNSQTVDLVDKVISRNANGNQMSQSIGGYKIKSSSLSISVPTAADTTMESSNTTVSGQNVNVYTQKTSPVITLDMVWGSFDPATT